MYITSKPYIYGIKDKLKIDWWKDHAQLRLDLEYTLYHFTTDGYTLVSNQPLYSMPDFANSDLLSRVPLGQKINNHVFGGYIEQKIFFGGLTLLPGLRSDYLRRTKQKTIDPRFMVSYEFPTQTTLSYSSGKYSGFIQTNSNLFNYKPNLADVGSLYKPEQAYHNSLSIEQKISLVTIKLEGFNNHFKNIYEDDPVYDANGKILVEGKSSGTQKVYGFEVLIRIDREQNADGLFGWIDYTYTHSEFKSGAFNNPDINKWITFSYEQRNSLKLVAGYVFGKHTISTRFQLFNGFPYTPITGSDESPDGSGRYVPIYYGSKPNSKRYPWDHRLDIRYSNTTNHEWGSVSWYIEVINIYNFKPISRQAWDYTRPYGNGNPKLKSDEGLSLLPNFGVEIKF